jgi:hypothetical protein
MEYGCLVIQSERDQRDNDWLLLFLLCLRVRAANSTTKNGCLLPTLNIVDSGFRKLSRLIYRNLLGLGVLETVKYETGG